MKLLEEQRKKKKIEMIINGYDTYLPTDSDCDGYVNNECAFECYISMVTNNSSLDECDYYVKNNDLFAYKTIMLGRQMFYDSDLGFELFNFRLT